MLYILLIVHFRWLRVVAPDDSTMMLGSSYVRGCVYHKVRRRATVVLVYVCTVCSR